MFKVIGTEENPDPDALKFVLNRPLVEVGVRQYDKARDASRDPLAARLFALGGVKSVFCKGGFITVEKSPNRSWDDLIPAIIKVVEEKAGTDKF
jgi:hypothetical protein